MARCLHKVSLRAGPRQDPQVWPLLPSLPALPALWVCAQVAVPMAVPRAWGPLAPELGPPRSGGYQNACLGPVLVAVLASREG